VSAKLREWLATKLLEWSGDLLMAAMRVCPEMFPAPEDEDFDDPYNDVINPRVGDDYDGGLPF